MYLRWYKEYWQVISINSQARERLDLDLFCFLLPPRERGPLFAAGLTTVTEPGFSSVVNTSFRSLANLKISSLTIFCVTQSFNGIVEVAPLLFWLTFLRILCFVESIRVKSPAFGIPELNIRSLHPQTLQATSISYRTLLKPSGLLFLKLNF